MTLHRKVDQATHILGWTLAALKPVKRGTAHHPGSTHAAAAAAAPEYYTMLDPSCIITSLFTVGQPPFALTQVTVHRYSYLTNIEVTHLWG